MWGCEIIKIETYFFKCPYYHWSEEVFMIKKVKNTLAETYVISYINGEKIIEMNKITES